jgi:hypothetical protein
MRFHLGNSARPYAMGNAQPNVGRADHTTRANTGHPRWSRICQSAQPYVGFPAIGG